MLTTMFHPLILLLALAPLSLLIPIKTLWAFYTALHNSPILPLKPSPLQRFRYLLHKLYFTFLVTGPGYVLEPPERICLDTIALALVTAIFYGLYILLPSVLSVLRLSGMFSWSWKENFGMGVDLKGDDVIRVLMNMNWSLARINGSEVVGM